LRNGINEQLRNKAIDISVRIKEDRSLSPQSSYYETKLDIS